VRGAFDAANRRDLDALLRCYAPDAVMDMTRGMGLAPRGQAAIRSVAEDWLVSYEELEWVAEEPLDLGNGVVFAIVRQRGRPVGITGYVQERGAWVWVWVDGVIASLTTYPEAEIGEARAAAERLAQERADG
jgi:ketosteroid isomerase-like protein